MYVTCLEQQSFCHALRKNLKFKLLYFQNKECYPAENKQADGNLDFLICDEDKNPKLCLVMNFSFFPYENLQPDTARIRPDSDHKVIFAA